MVSCIGGFGSNAEMERVNGDINVQAASVAAREGVARFVLVSAHDFGFPPWLLAGYVNGKRRAEVAALQEFAGGKATVLRPGMIYGYRHLPVAGGVALPLGLIGRPAEMVLEAVPQLQRLVGPPPVSVEVVARAAIAGERQRSSTMPPVRVCARCRPG